MPQKNAKIDDVKRPEKITPSATSRPILVSSQPSAPSDPMMVSADGEKKEDETPQVMTHTAKTITPLSKISSEEEKEDSPESSTQPAASAVPDTASKPPADDTAEKEPKTAAREDTDEPKSRETAVQTGAADKPSDADDSDRDPDAALSAEETAAAEAKVKREEEIEALIESGKYAVPINAVQRRQSRMHSIALGLLALLLLLALLDVVFDVGLVHVPSAVPHTHFFSGR